MYIIYIYTYTFKLYQSEIKLQTKVQITQQHQKFELKNSYKIKEIIANGKIK